MDMLQTYSNTGCQRLHITAPLGLTQSYITKLFNLIPGLEYCDLNEQTGKGSSRIDHAVPRGSTQIIVYGCYGLSLTTPGSALQSCSVLFLAVLYS